MKRIYILSLGLILFQSANAQITLTAATHTPKVGDDLALNDAIIYLEDSEAGFEALQGANQTWDFSNVTYDVGNDAAFYYIAPENDYFPTATTVLSLPQPWTGYLNDYMLVDEEALHIVGQHNPSAEQKHIYTDGYDLLRFPMNFGDSYTDEFDGIINFGFFDLGKIGTVTVSADAYGELILPSGTLSNVLRVKTVTNYGTGAVGETLEPTKEEIRYDWYHTDSNLPVLTCRRPDQSITLFPWRFGAINDAAFQSLSLNEEHTLLNNIHPNPATNYVVLPADAKWSKLYDINGRVVKSSAEAQQQIDTSDIKSGIYFVSFGIGEQVHRKKLVVQH